MAYITNLEQDTRPIYREFGNSLSDDNDDYNKVPLLEGDSGYLNPDVEKNIAAVYEKSKERKKSLRPIYDWKTKNKTFIEVHMDLKRLGIKNNKFFLILFDPDLQGVDPYAPLIPLDLQVKIMAECVRNPWYFLREICRIPADGTPVTVGGGAQFRLDRNALASWYLMLHNIDHYTSKPRQRGKTQNALAQIDYIFHFGAMSSTITFSNKDATNNKLNLYRLKCQRDMLPTYLQMRTSFDFTSGKMVKENNNVTTMRNPITGNNIQLLPRANSHDTAMSNGRGMTSAIQYFDEFDFMPWNTTTLESSAFAYSTARENAINHGNVSLRLFSSTPGDLDSRDGSSASEFIDHMVRWDDTMYDKPISYIESLIHDANAKRNGIMYVEHTWKQLKCTQKWYEKQCELVSHKQETIMREIDLMRIHGSSLSPFNREDIIYLMSRMEKNEAAAVDRIDYGFNNSIIYTFSHLKRNVPYILGIDPSEGLGADNNALSIISPYDLSLQGEMKSPYISQPNFAKMIVKLMDDYCPSALIVIENNKGREMINCLLETKYRDRIWYDKKKLADVSEQIRLHGHHTKEAFQRRAFGFNTNPSSRNLLMGTLETMMNENKNAMIGEYLITDICGLIRTNTGKIAAGAGNHDDNVLSYLLGVTVFRIADNLEEFGLYRGMTEHGLLGIEEESRTPIEKIKELISQVPDNLRGMFEDVLKAQDPLLENREFNREVQREMTLRNPDNANSTRNSAINEMVYGASDYDSFANDIINANDDLEIMGSSDDSFDVLDFI